MYNVEAYVDEAIRSILNQTWQDLELIIVNDGSSDLSLSIAESACRGDPRARIVSQANAGLADARNRGLKEASGSYIYLFDSDDILQPDALHTCLTLALDMGLDLVAFGGEAFIDGSSLAQVVPDLRKPDWVLPQTGQKILTELCLIKSFSVSCCLYLFSRRLIENPPLRFDVGFIHEDEAFTTLLYCNARRAITLSNPFFRRRIRTNSIMTSRRSFTNAAGCIQAMQRIAGAELTYSELDSACLNVLRGRQRSLLRQSVIDAFSCRMIMPLIHMLSSKFSLLSLLRIDPLIGPFAAWQLFRSALLRSCYQNRA